MLFNLITGDLAADSGTIRLFEQNVSALGTARRARLGLARTFQIVTLFPRDTVLHNVVLALYGNRHLRWDPLFSLESRADLREEGYAILARVGLDRLANQPVWATSYGEQRRLELALAFAQRPKLLLLDEPLAGLSARERLEVQRLIDQIPRSIAIIMIEHDMNVALSFAERVSLRQDSRLVVDGTREEVIAHPKTREVYLGH